MKDLLICKKKRLDEQSVLNWGFEIGTKYIHQYNLSTVHNMQLK